MIIDINYLLKVVPKVAEYITTIGYTSELLQKLDIRLDESSECCLTISKHHKNRLLRRNSILFILMHHRINGHVLRLNSISWNIKLSGFNELLSAANRCDDELSCYLSRNCKPFNINSIY